MLDPVAALPAGIAAAAAVFLLTASPAGPSSLPVLVARRIPDLRRVGDGRLLLSGACAGMVAGVAAWALTGMPALAAAASVLGAGALAGALRARINARRRERQDAVLAAVRMLRQLLETGAVGVSAGLDVLAERGPVALRPEFASIAGGGGRPAAWAAARARVGEPLFDLLAAAVLVQRPGGGQLGPLFASLEEAVTGVYEVEREAAALQVQARSASTLILCLPLAFLAVMCLLRSPYLDVYRTPAGQLFLAGMLLVMGAAHVVVRRWLRLPEEPRLELVDA